jgi:tetratricopeptide (TPR) repeat protein
MKALRVIDALVHNDPKNLDWQDALASQHRNLANFVPADGDQLEALSHAEAAVEIASRVVREAPALPRYSLNLHLARFALGHRLRGLAQPVEAEREMRAALEIVDHLIRRDRNDWGILSARVDNLSGLALLLSELKRFDEAEAALTKALRDSETLSVAYPLAHDGFRTRTITLRRYLAEAQLGRGRIREAEESYRGLIADLEELLRAKPESISWRRVLADIYFECPVASLRNPGRAKELRGSSGFHSK